MKIFRLNSKWIEREKRTVSLDNYHNYHNYYYSDCGYDIKLIHKKNGQPLQIFSPFFRELLLEEFNKKIDSHFKKVALKSNFVTNEDIELIKKTMKQKYEDE